MGKRKPGFTLEQHDQLGLELQAMRDSLNQIVVKISHHYPLSTDALKKSKIALSAIDNLRSKLDDLVCSEQNGNNSIDPVRIYYRSIRKD